MEKADLPLKKGATNLVFGEGNPDARIFFLGEGPGYWENMKGRPFVGNAGGLLNQLLQSIKLVREDVFITNVVCYRPPSNRDPLPEEISAFQPYIDAMLEVIRPKVVVTLGRFSMGKFLPGTKISIVHGKVFDVNWRGRQIKVVPMYHPAAALRNGNVMIQIKEDFLKLPELLKELNSKIEAEQMELV
ncbi:MAG: Phage SPO1 DNA polymerase-related protein [Candidatus Woesebacteria bacterium GW2011_GWF2_46_8]|uniref:Type-4 uracil-DNA glycosylase n=1 Tax=Candidatus Woesebacteria bacterium GW2011_GWF2_46_8 TaxID=1618604 RepID=A0A0G1SZF6_9BACT|nr:MAG: Phage SPO1 DNA polymerase-related protein [Candidatus Woesebacteria bacterium GW2011_GWF2_46_8]